MKLDKAYINVSVSTGTLDVDELVRNCAGFLRSCRLDPATTDRLLAAEQRLAASLHLDDDPTPADKKDILFNNLMEILKDISPEGCFFGIHPGDPGTLGFWDKSINFRPR
ncbi:MAG: hypothetical protein PVI71_02265 [Desulfobacterales bacterium]|jgi:hypothetical protein